MSDAAATAESGPLSVDQAIGLLSAEPAPPDDQEQAPAATEETPSEAESTAEDAPEPEEAIEGEEELEPESEPELPAIAAPHSWTAEERARFATLPRETQEFLAHREGERDKAVSKAQQEAAEARKSADNLTETKSRLDQVAERAVSVFANRWAEWDQNAWLNYARQDPNAYTVLRAEYESEMGELQQLQAAQQQAQALAFKTYIDAEAARLPEVAPDLADPKEGKARLGKVADFLGGLGYSSEQLNGVSARDLSLAYDAMRWREAQAGLATKPKPVAASVKPALKPTAAAASSSQTRSAGQIRNRFAQTRSVDDAVALLLAKG